MVPLQEGLEAKHMEMALETHRKTVQAMFDLNVEEYFHRVSSCTFHVQSQHISSQVEKDQQVQVSTIKSWRKKNDSNPKFPLCRGELHLSSSLNVLCNYFFAHDKQIYGRLILL